MNLKHGVGQEIIAVGKQGQQGLFLDPEDLPVLAVFADLPSRPHELRVFEQLSKAYVPIYGDGIHDDTTTPNYQV